MGDGHVQDRVNAVPPDGIIARSGVSVFRSRYSKPESAEKFFEWSKLPETKLALSALEDLAVNGPVGMANPPQDYLVQYGMTLGLNLAAQILRDPSLVFPEVFRGRPVQMPSAMEPDFETEPENA